MNKIFNSYTIYARIYPSILSATPLFILWYFLSIKNKELVGLSDYLFQINWTGKISISMVFIYFFSQVIRTVSKFYEMRLFIKNNGFPTTYLMTYVDESFSKQYKTKYRVYVKSDFNIKLFNESDEQKNKIEAYKQLNEATKQVILYVGRGVLVEKHNIWYGFFRNLVGGSSFSIVFSFGNIILAFYELQNNLFTLLSILLLILFFFIFLFRKRILIQHAEAYARQLISEYISMH